MRTWYIDSPNGIISSQRFVLQGKVTFTKEEEFDETQTLKSITISFSPLIEKEMLAFLLDILLTGKPIKIKHIDTSYEVIISMVSEYECVFDIYNSFSA